MDPTNAERLAAGLPEWLPRGPETENAKLLEAVGTGLDRIEADFREAGNAVHPQTAGSIALLEKLGARMGVSPLPGETKESYRVRVMAAHQLLTTEGTADELLGNLATLLGARPRSLKVRESTEPGTFTIAVPSEALSNIGLSTEALNDIVKDQLAAGYRPIITASGTLNYISADEYDAGDYDASAGYDGLDAGEPTGEGGTYGSLLE
jgi:hypothetical protein